MKKIIFVVLMVLIFVFLGVAQKTSVDSTEDAAVPDNVNISLDALLKTRTSNQVYKMKFVDDFYFTLQTAPDKVYANVLLNAEVDEDIKVLKAEIEKKFQAVKTKYDTFVENKLKEVEEENKKIENDNKGRQKDKRIPKKTWEKPPAPEIKYPASYHNLYLRVVKDGKIIQRFKSPVPFEKTKLEFYSFGLILKPGKYDILININRYNDTQDGTLLIEMTVPSITLRDLVAPMNQLENSEPNFYKKMSAVRSVEQRFTVLRNRYQVGQQLFFPYTGKELFFKASESPALAFFIKGAANIVNNQPQWNLTANIEFVKGKKKVVVFKTEPFQAPYFFQKLVFKKGEKPLPAGDYMLSINLIDNNKKGRKRKIEIPFKIVE